MRIIAALFLALLATARAVELTWSTNPDPLTVGYRVYYGDSGGYTNAVDVGASLTASIQTLPGVTYSFAVTSYNAAGLESNFSPELRYTAPTFPPLTITVLRGSNITGNFRTMAVLVVTNSQASSEFFKLRIQ